MTKVLSKDFSFVERKFMMVQNSILKQKHRFPLDYIVQVPKLLRPRKYKRKAYDEVLKRRNLLKNVVYLKLLHIKSVKSKPKLKDILQRFRQIREEDLPNKKDLMRSKFE
mmetsp:Transcript_22329/g.34569  ORF Transcript_22329/g.34569 Transcript_22329/m.34569 type:complete len:110 (-) Transcript_22329:1152-1481(-)